MSNKKFKIKPKVWPKEYTFEEFKRLNPNINENLLINYYHKYIQEYAENRSRYIKHFDNTKDDLSKELKLLNEKINFLKYTDGDQTVGITAAGRKYRYPLKGNFHSVQFDHTDDYAIYFDPVNKSVETALPPRQGSIRPTEQLTVLAWVNLWDGNLLNGDFGAKVDTIVGTRDYNDGWQIQINYRRINFTIRTNAPETGPHDGSVNLQCIGSSNAMLSEDKIYYREQHPGWMFIICTFDGRYAKMYNQGLIASGNGTSDTGTTAHIQDAGSEGHTICYQRSSNLATYGSASMFGGVVVGADGRYNFNSGEYKLLSAQSLFSGSIGEVAIWDKALDADTILEIYSGSKGPYEKRYDLSYPGYGGRLDHPYDLNDEGISYKNVGKYAGSLQAWWRLEEGTGTTIKDYSGKNRDMTLNSGTWDSTLGTSASASPGV